MPQPPSPTLSGLLNEAARLAPVGGLGPASPGTPPPSLLARVRSRLAYLIAHLFTPRQKRFNLAVCEVVRGLVDVANALRQEAVALRQEADNLRVELDDARQQLVVLAEQVASLKPACDRMAGLASDVVALRANLDPVHPRLGAVEAAVWETADRRAEYPLDQTGGADPEPLLPDLETIECSVALPGGGRLTLVLDRDTTDPVAHHYLNGAAINDWLLSLLESLTRPGDRVLDLGAHVGTFALSAAALGRRVVAVDANTKHVELLRRSRQANGLTNLKVVHAAVGDRLGTCRFVENGLFGMVDPGGAGGSTVRVRLTTPAAILHSAGWDRVALLKMDIEGSEVAALRGMAEWLRADDGPVVVYESNGMTLRLFGHTVADLRHLLQDYGYTTYRLVGGRFAPAGPDDFQPEAWLDVVALKPCHAATLAGQIIPPLTQAETAALIRVWSGSEHAPVREYLAREIRSVDRQLREEPPVREAMAALLADPIPEVRAAAGWWPGTARAAA